MATKHSLGPRVVSFQLSDHLPFSHLILAGLARFRARLPSILVADIRSLSQWGGWAALSSRQTDRQMTKPAQG